MEEYVAELAGGLGEYRHFNPVGLVGGIDALVGHSIGDLNLSSAGGRDDEKLRGRVCHDAGAAGVDGFADTVERTCRYWRR